jgi:hypothetical protein
VELEQDFDALVGRFILMYSADPVTALRKALHAVRPNGVAVFYECNFLAGLASFPVSPLHQFVGDCVTEEVSIETFEPRYREEVLRQRSVVQWSCVGGLARKPLP